MAGRRQADGKHRPTAGYNGRLITVRTVSGQFGSHQSLVLPRRGDYSYSGEFSFTSIGDFLRGTTGSTGRRPRRTGMMRRASRHDGRGGHQGCTGNRSGAHAIGRSVRFQPGRQAGGRNTANVAMERRFVGTWYHLFCYPFSQ